MVVTRRRGTAGPSAAQLAVIWHDLECGGYGADLPMWRALAASAGARILEIGAGSGRVAVDLAAAGHDVTALDLDRALLEALHVRASGMAVDVVCADARTFELDRRDFGLCLAPMQTVQLLGGEGGRVEFLRRARAHLRPGGLLACAIVTDFELFDCSLGENAPIAETVRIAGTDYVSRAIRISAREQSVVIERQRQVLRGGHEIPGAGERDAIALDLLSVEQLECEGAAAGLRPETAGRIEATEDHLGSDVVMLRA
jgi:SAM-dependent methyltransferase